MEENFSTFRQRKHFIKLIAKVNLEKLEYYLKVIDDPKQRPQDLLKTVRKINKYFADLRISEFNHFLEENYNFHSRIMIEFRHENELKISFCNSFIIGKIQSLLCKFKE